MTAKEISDLLLSQNQTLSIAESCTGGGLMQEITSISGASQIFFGGIVAYANEAKQHLLQVPKELIQKSGAVSEDVAVAMAENCRRLFSSTWAIATTGISGPSGGSLEKPVGTVWIAVSGPSSSVDKFLFTGISRLEHRQKTIEQAFTLLAAAIAK